jgi:hypothetical protein
MLGFGGNNQFMKRLFWLAVFTGLLAGILPATTIQFQVTNLGQNLDRYTYFVSGITLQANQELDLRFSPSLYSNLTNGIAPSAYSLLLMQPNNPPGTSGDYRALALTNSPSLAGPFSVDFTFLGAGIPGPQPFFINQYSPSGLFLSTIESGSTTPFSQPGVPEPATFSLGCVALLVGGVFLKVRRRSVATAQ